MSKTRKEHRRGFTLVELLVVIAIISILAGLLLPALESALGAARLTSCANQHRQIATAATLYADDWGGMLPYGHANNPNVAQFYWRANALLPYVAPGRPDFQPLRETIFRCPSPKTWHPNMTDPPPDYQELYPSYQYGLAVLEKMAWGATDPLPRRKNLREFPSPSASWIFADCYAGNEFAIMGRSTPAWGAGNPDDPTELPASRVNWAAHDERLIISFLDCHAQSYGRGDY